MTKHEVKVEMAEKDLILNIIEKAYPRDNQGKINGKDNYMIVDEKNENFSIFKGLDGSTVKITNQEIIDGTMRMMVEEVDNKVKLFPISIYCLKDENQGRYIFY